MVYLGALEGLFEYFDCKQGNKTSKEHIPHAVYEMDNTACAIGNLNLWMCRCASIFCPITKPLLALAALRCSGPHVRNTDEASEHILRHQKWSTQTENVHKNVPPYQARVRMRVRCYVSSTINVSLTLVSLGICRTDFRAEFKVNYHAVWQSGVSVLTFWSPIF